MIQSHPTTIQHSIRDFLIDDSPISMEIPEHFLEFCKQSMEKRRGGTLYANQIVPEQLHMQEEARELLNVKSLNNNNLLKLSPSTSERPVAAVDTSTIRLGELDEGALCALRGAVVILEGKRYRYIRYGPLIFFLDNNPRTSEIRPEVSLMSGISNLDLLLRRVRSSLERWLQLNLCSSFTNGIILFDGSLTAGTPDNPAAETLHILDQARMANNAVFAISKNTQLRIDDLGITSLLEHKPDPCLMNVDEEVRSQFAAYPIKFLGRVYVGKLARGGLPFRIDMDRKVPEHEGVVGLEQLSGTDIVDQGYPETLRMAHILSTFTAADVLAIQSLAVARFGVQLIPRLSLRRSLFGPFGTGWEMRH